MLTIKKISRQVLFAQALFFPFVSRAAETVLGEADNFGELVSLFWTWSAKVILTLSVLTLIAAGFMYMSAGGSESKVNQAKDVGQGAIIASIIVLFSGVLQRFLKAPTEEIAPGEAQLNELPNVIQNVANTLLSFVGAFAVLVLVINGVQYMLANGDEEKLNKAKRHSKYAVFGLVFAVLSYTIMSVVVNFWIG